MTIENNEIKRNKLTRHLKHEIQNDLNVAFHYLKKINVTSEDEPKVFKVRKILNKLNKKISSLAEYDFVVAKKGNLTLEDFSLFDIFDNEVINQAEEIAQRDLRLTLDIAEDAILETDIELMCIIVERLFENAIQFSTYSGEIIITYKELDYGRKVLTISNSSKAIPKYVLDSIYTVHERSVVENLLGEKGDGFGLPIVFEALSSLGGSISHSHLDGKTTFEILL